MLRRCVYFCAVTLLLSIHVYAGPATLAVCEESEPNETFEKAKTLTSGQPCGGFATTGHDSGMSINHKGQQDGIEDFWKIHLPHAGRILATLDIETAGQDMDIFIIRQSGAEVSRGNSSFNMHEETSPGEFLAGGRDYYIGVSAFQGGSDYVVKATVSPASPSDLNLTPGQSNQITLIWADNSDNENGFRVQVKKGDAGVFTNYAGFANLNANTRNVTIPNLDRNVPYVFRVVAFNEAGESPATAEKAFTAGAGCTSGSTKLCLSGARFEVTATYRPPSEEVRKPMTAVPMTSDTGYLWFNQEANVEVVVKVLNGCGINQRFWVFAGGLTNVEADLVVTDTMTGLTKAYHNPQSTAFQPIQDTGAFATCP